MIATTTSTQELPLLPPSERDFEIFRTVKVEGCSTRGAAMIFRISQTRVRQVLPRVEKFLLATAPAEADPVSQEKSLYVAQVLAQQQLEYLYGEANKMWLRSQEMSPIALGKASYLGMASRIAMLMAKLPFHMVPAMSDEEEEEPQGSQESQESQPSHPDGDCSGSPPRRKKWPLDVPPENYATGCEELPYDRPIDEVAVAKRAFFGPAQLPEASLGFELHRQAPARQEPRGSFVPGEDPGTETGEDPGTETRAPLHPPLNRRQRKARQRQLDKIRKKRERRLR